jgi:uncharacterized protein (TIGR02217 family)
MTSFHEVQFPLRLALGTSGGPSRRTDIVSLSNGRENRNRRWKDARRRYDVGSGRDTHASLEFNYMVFRVSDYTSDVEGHA